MKTTLNFDDRLIRAAKQRAAAEDMTLTRLIECALRNYLQPTPFTDRSFRARLLTKGGWKMPGIDLDDRVSLYEWMDPVDRD